MRRKRADCLERYLRVADVLHYGSNKEFNLMLYGHEDRVGMTDEYLPYLVKKGKLRRTKVGKEYVYIPKRVRYRNDMYPKLPHYVACAKCLARIWRALPDGQVIAEREFIGLGVIPEWGIEYSGGTLLLFEFCTESNYRYSGLLRGKIDAYQKHLPEIEAKFKATVMVLFVIDIPREIVVNYVGTKNGMSALSASTPRYQGGLPPLTPIYFVDYKTFLSQPIGTHLQSKIYVYSNGEIDSLV